MALDDFDLLAIAAGDKAKAAKALLERPFQLYHFDEEPDEAPAAKPGASGADAVAKENYQPSDELGAAVNVSLATGRPLLLTGEPGCGKTSAAKWVAERLGIKSHRFQVRSDSRAGDLLYNFDAVDHFRRSQIAAMQKDKDAVDLALSLNRGPMWEALDHDDNVPHLLLIDEIDKAPRDFPNDLLFELDRLSFKIKETGETIKPRKPGLRPMVVITSNSERRLPEPFLRRCVYHHIEMDNALIERIVGKRLAAIEDTLKIDPELRKNAMRCFIALRDDYTLQKRPSVDEFWQWLACLARADPQLGYPAKVKAIAEAGTGYGELPLLSPLVKLDEDLNRI